MIEIKLKDKNIIRKTCEQEKIVLPDYQNILIYSAQSSGEEEGVCIFRFSAEESEIFLLKARNNDFYMKDALIRSTLNYLLIHGSKTAVLKNNTEDKDMQLMLKRLKFEQKDIVWAVKLREDIFNCGCSK